MEEKPTCDVKILGHLGLIAAIFKEYDIIDRINLYLPKTSNHQFLSHGEIIFAMVLQGLGFTNNRTYLSAEFFSHVAIRELFGKDVEPHHFNSDVYRRTLDAIFDHGPTRFFTDICFGIILAYDLLKKFFYIDTTSLSVTGKKYKNRGNIELKRGYSKDHRMDLKQLVYLLVATDDGIPIFSEAHSGNVSDNEIFQNTIIKVQGLLKDRVKNHIWVVDSALYNLNFLLNKNIKGDWISRVPENIKLCKDTLEKNYDDLLWHKIDNNYKYIELEVEYGGKKQRWILVRNRKSKYKEIETFVKNLDKEEVIIEKSIKSIQKKIFLTKEEASNEIETQKKYHPNFIIKGSVKGFYKSRKGSRRRIRIGYTVTVSYVRNNLRIEKMKMRKGKFILATNHINDEKLSASEILEAYRGRNRHIESCFKFIKDRTYSFNQIFLQHEGRIEAMVAVMSFILFVNNLAQKTLRNHLVRNKEKIPNQLGQGSTKPTFKWASYIMRNITKVRMMIQGKVYETIKGINRAQETVIRAFGKIAIEIYGMT